MQGYCNNTNIISIKIYFKIYEPPYIESIKALTAIKIIPPTFFMSEHGSL